MRTALIVMLWLCCCFVVETLNKNEKFVLGLPFVTANASKDYSKVSWANNNAMVTFPTAMFRDGSSGTTVNFVDTSPDGAPLVPLLCVRVVLFSNLVCSCFVGFRDVSFR